MRFILLSALALLLTAQAPSALAATLHKCVGADGKATYSDRPCEGTPGKTIKVAPLPPPVTHADDEQPDDQGDDYSNYEDEPEQVEESDEQVYARKALERRTEALKRKQAQAALAKAGPATRPCTTGNNCKDKH
jgi:hypothetical protein